MKVTTITSLLMFVLLAVLPSSSFSATDSFTMSYSGQGVVDILLNTCTTSFAITGQEPSAPGTYPVFVYTVGTLEFIDNNGTADAAVAGMANRGFVAAAVQYDTLDFAGCDIISGKARCIYNPASPTSAIAQLCSRPKADCSKGIVVGGFSQGSVIATLAKNFDSRVLAAWGMGEGVQYAIFNLRACMANGNHALASDHLRAVNGQFDQFVGSSLLNPNGGRQQAQELTGFTCGPSAFSCLQGNGSGWYIVRESEINGGQAEHCYMRQFRSNLAQCALFPELLNDQWRNDAAPWSLNSNLDWLKSFIP
jgi:hypothetical protein